MAIIKLHSCCIPCRGAGRSAIYDLQRTQVFFIPNSLFELLDNNYHAFDPEALILKLSTTEGEVIKEYTDFLKEHELACELRENELDSFPMLSTEYLFPGYITNCVLDTENDLEYFNEGFVKQLEALCCNHIQIRFFNGVSFGRLRMILNLLNPRQVKSIELILKYCAENSFNEHILKLINEYRKIRNITVFEAPNDEILKSEEALTGSVFMLKAKAASHLHCGIVQLQQFAVNIPHYTESQYYNTCLHRKIAIDVKGNIKNCPSMEACFGNINDTTLEEALNKPDFKKYWNITKDQVTKCKDCEFRHICTDCRAYTDTPVDIYAAPLKCGYDPYTCEWEEWSTHPLKQEAIDYYGMRHILVQ